MTIGDVVVLKTPCLGEDLHSVGVVFNDYGSGVQVMFEKGGYDGFGNEEQDMFLILRGHDAQSSMYHFKNVMSTSIDFESGFWDHVFSDPKYKL